MLHIYLRKNETLIPNSLSDHLGDPDVDGRIILRWFFRKCHVGGVDWIELAQDTDRWRELVTVGNEPSGSIKRGGFPDWLKTC